MKYEYIEHTADVQFKAYGTTLEEAFENSLGAMMKIVCEDSVKHRIEKVIKVGGSDYENLLYNFLEEILILFDSEHFLFGSIKEIFINEDNFELKAKILGDDAKNYKILTHIKAVTYNNIFVKKKGNKWTCQVTLDI
jgi:SHS2 domain-containing protein